MASATGIPEQVPHDETRGEEEPLLGRVGDASQPEGSRLYYNLIIGPYEWFSDPGLITDFHH
jgi:hypothetical protein